jgi:hypothetical protein
MTVTWAGGGSVCLRSLRKPAGDEWSDGRGQYLPVLQQGVLCQVSGLNQSTISLLDRGERKPTLDTLVRIAGVLRIELGEILLQATEDIRAGRDLKNAKRAQARSERAR